MAALTEGASPADVVNQIEDLQKQDDLLEEGQTFLPQLAQVLNGERDVAVADDTALNFYDAAELLFLIERLSEMGA